MSLGAPFGSLYISGKWPLHLCRVQRGQIVVLNDSPVRYREHKIGNEFFLEGNGRLHRSAGTHRVAQFYICDEREDVKQWYSG